MELSVVRSFDDHVSENHHKRLPYRALQDSSVCGHHRSPGNHKYEEYQGQGFFSILVKYMLNDLKTRGYKYATLGVEPTELKNKAIYQKLGFTEYLENAKEVYPDGKIVEVEYYRKKL